MKTFPILPVYTAWTLDVFARARKRLQEQSWLAMVPNATQLLLGTTARMHSHFTSACKEQPASSCIQA